jgi:uncharacterized RDD family membrane protein YckC
LIIRYNRIRIKARLNMDTNDIVKEIRYVGFWRRLLAFIFNVIIVSPILFFYTRQYTYFLEYKIVIPVLLFTIISYSFQVFFDVRYGGTPGKLITGIRIVNSEGKYITVLQSLYRLSPQLVANILFVIGHFFIASEIIKKIPSIIESGFTWFYFIDVFVIILNKRKRAIHDYIADTFVVTKQSLQNIKGNANEFI